MLSASYGKHKGYKVDASATIDPRLPVYHSDCEATPIPERNDSESTSQPQRKHSESTANPRIPTTSTAGEPSLIVGRLETEVDVVVAGVSSDKLNGQGQRLESEQRGVDRGRLMGAVRTIWNRLRGQFHLFRTTAEHINAAIALSGTPGRTAHNDWGSQSTVGFIPQCGIIGRSGRGQSKSWKHTGG